MSDFPNQTMIRFYPERCIQCHGCEAACKAWRDLPPGVRYRRVFNLWEGVFPQVTSASLSLACLHCVDPACVSVCPVEAISKQATDGRVLVDTEICIGCRACAEACPFDVPQFGGDEVMQKCDQCVDQPLAGTDPPCVATCPGKALILEKVTLEVKKAHEQFVAKTFDGLS